MTTPDTKREGHTPTPYCLLPVSDTFKIVTTDGERFAERNHYLAGEPFIATVNDDFSTDADNDEAKKTNHYRAIRNPERVKANAAFIVQACNSYEALVKALEAVKNVLDAQKQSRPETHSHYVLMAKRLLAEHIEPALTLCQRGGGR